MTSVSTFLLTLAYCLPVLVLVLPLLARRYVGEETLARRQRRCRAPRHPPAASDPPSGHRPQRVWPATGGALLAVSLAGRAPPPGLNT